MRNDKRHDGDSWDLASSVGATATMVAASRALATRSAEPLIHDPYAEPLVRAVGIEYFVHLLDGTIPGGHPASDAEVSSEHMAVRTRFYDDFFLNAVRGGIRQVVILAAGLDTRAYRLAWPDGTVVHEIDLPAVLDFKSSTLHQLGAEPGARHRAIAVDLRDDWPAALRAAGFDPAQPTAWCAEGLLVYLPPAAQDRLFDHITGLSAPRSQLACEYLPDMSVFGRESLRELFEQAAVDVRELVYSDGDRSHVPDQLRALGWASTLRTAEQLYTANGRNYPDSPELALFADVTYLRAELD